MFELIQMYGSPALLTLLCYIIYGNVNLLFVETHLTHRQMSQDGILVNNKPHRQLLTISAFRKSTALYGGTLFCRNSTKDFQEVI